MLKCGEWCILSTSRGNIRIEYQHVVLTSLIWIFKESPGGAYFTLRGRGFQGVRTALAKARFLKKLHVFIMGYWGDINPINTGVVMIYFRAWLFIAWRNQCNHVGKKGWCGLHCPFEIQFQPHCFWQQSIFKIKSRSHYSGSNRLIWNVIKPSTIIGWDVTVAVIISYLFGLSRYFSSFQLNNGWNWCFTKFSNVLIKAVRMIEEQDCFLGARSLEKSAGPEHWSIYSIFIFDLHELLWLKFQSWHH